MFLIHSFREACLFLFVLNTNTLSKYKQTTLASPLRSVPTDLKNQLNQLLSFFFLYFRIFFLKAPSIKRGCLSISLPSLYTHSLTHTHTHTHTYTHAHTRQRSFLKLIYFFPIPTTLTPPAFLAHTETHSHPRTHI